VRCRGPSSVEFGWCQLPGKTSFGSQSRSSVDRFSSVRCDRLTLIEAAGRRPERTFRRRAKRSLSSPIQCSRLFSRKNIVNRLLLELSGLIDRTAQKEKKNIHCARHQESPSTAVLQIAAVVLKIDEKKCRKHNQNLDERPDTTHVYRLHFTGQNIERGREIWA